MIILKKLIKRFLKKIFKKLDLVSGEELSEVINKNYIVERDLFATYKALECKVCEFNNYTNQLLYDMYFNSKKKKKNFNPLVSIIIPVYNGLTKKVADGFKKKIRYYEKENGGVSSALNYGISKMKGEYFAWLSHDDSIAPTHIQNLVDFISIEGNDKCIPFSSFKIVDENGTLKVNETIIAKLHCFDYKTSVLKNEYTLLQGEINGGSVLIPKIAFDKHGLFSETQRITQERDMWARLIKEYKFINIPYDTAIIRSHSKQVTNTNPKIKIETDEKNLEIIKNLSKEVINKLESNEASFYSVMENFYKIIIMFIWKKK